ncbi:mucin-2-like [Drosophila montana]|uniref:mucin-2-like n=1 Tax=Drosophila montana TaxID=40370 RepID=UPI00313A9027
MNVWLVLLSVLYSTTIIFCKVLIADNSITLPNNIGSREDWFILAKYYASIHKPYNVKKYVPYKPSNNTATVETPLASLPIHTSTTALPEIPTQTSSYDSKWNNSTEGDHIEQTSETGIVETSTFESTTETLTSTTEMPETSTLLLSIIGKTPGIEATTSYYDAIVESTEQQYLSSTIETGSMVNEAISTTTTSPEPETTTELRDSTFQTYNETSYTSEAPASSIDVTTEISFDAVSTSSPPETTTDVGDTTTRPPIFTVETPSSAEETTNINFVLPTTSFEQETTTELGVTTTSSEPDTTTDEADTTTQLLITTTQSPPTTSSQPDTTTDEADKITQLSITTTQCPPTTSSDPDTTTDEADTTTQLLITTTQSPPTTSSQPDTTTDEADATTQFPITTTQSPPRTSSEPDTRTDEADTTSSELEATTETADTTTQIPISTTQTTLLENTTTELPFIPTSTIAFEGTTEADADVEVTTAEPMAKTTSGNAILVDDIIQAKPRKFTYSSDVMPEMEW